MNKRRIYTFQEDLEKRLKNPAFQKAWKESEADYLLSVKIIEARLSRKISQRELAQKMKTSQAAISRIEGMNGNPSFSMLNRIAHALDMKLQIDFVAK